jgi:hypothetical protein
MTQFPGEYAPLLVLVLVLAALGTLALLGLAFAAYRRRGTRPYLLVVAVLVLLVARTVVGIGTVFAVVPMLAHHLVEHSIDLLTAAVLLYAVYTTPLGTAD